jgi:hypothetical protein
MHRDATKVENSIFSPCSNIYVLTKRATIAKKTIGNIALFGALNKTANAIEMLVAIKILLII